MEEKKEPVILVTNDDGITAPGIRNLVEAVKGLGKIVVVAPDKAQSGMGHAITIGSPLRLHKVHMFDDVNIDAYQCSGTPVDCVKLAVDKVLHQKPDICISGINHGANHSINVIYSGTMSAAVEAAIESIPSVGFSLLDYALEADFSAARHYARIIVEQMLKTTPDKHCILNVNFPIATPDQIKGLKICRQAYAKYEEDFIERYDPHKRKYYWLTGEFVNFDEGTDTDVWALANNYVSVVPVQFDLTNYKLKTQLENDWNIFLKKDNLQLGIALGLLLPLVVFFVIYLVRFRDASLPDFVSTFATQKSLITFFGVWCLVSNIALFTYYVNTQKDKTAKGIFAMTLVYGIGILLAKVLI